MPVVLEALRGQMAQLVQYGTFPVQGGGGGVRQHKQRAWLGTLSNSRSRDKKSALLA